MTEITATETTMYLRRRGPITDGDLSLAAGRLVDDLIQAGSERHRFDGAEMLAEALSVAGLTPFDDVDGEHYECGSRGDDDSREIEAVWSAFVTHLHSSGAIAAAIRFALYTAMQEIGERQAEHVTPAELAAMFVCSENGDGENRPHLPRNEMTRIRHHVLYCESCSCAAEAIYQAGRLMKGTAA